MANAQVEKVKTLALRHGEKAVVGLSAALCLLFLVFAVIKPTIALTPEQVASAAKAAEANLNRPQDEADILKRLEDEGLKSPSFEKLVDAQAKEKLDTLAFKVDRQWVSQEPGAGLIRSKPELIAPAELYAYPGRGGALIFALNDEGKRIPEDPDAKKDDSTKARRLRKKRRRSSMGGMMGSMMGGSGRRRGGSGGMMGGYGGMMGGGGPAPDSPEAKKELERREKELKRQLAGKAGADADKAKDKEKTDDDDSTQEGGPFKEVTKGLRWVVLTGVLDHKKMRDNYEAALKSTTAQPNYRQLGVQRQSRDRDGNWSEWEDVDMEKNHAITYNLPEEEEELTPDEVRIDALVDPLPFLKAGYWEKVHVVSLVPKEKREIARPAGGMDMSGSGMSMPGGAMMGSGGMGSGGMGRPGGMKGMSMMGSGSGMMGSGSGYGSMMGGGAGAVEENTDFQKSESDKIMIRALDFTVEPDTTYRYRVQVVVFNPNLNREDVAPGVDTTSVDLKGPFSEPSEPVTMPADVTAYALKKAPAGQGAKRNDLVQFEITRWNPEDGVTVVRTFESGLGQIVGEPRTSQVPTSEGTGAKSKLIDYNSRQILLDETGGPQAVNQLGARGGDLEVPAVSLLMRPDGSVVLRSEVSDRPDPVRKDMSESYAREVKESTKKRENSQGSGYGSMMGGSGGMMGGGRGGR